MTRSHTHTLSLTHTHTHTGFHMTLASLGLRLCASFETYCKVQIKDLPADVEGERKGEGEGEHCLHLWVQASSHSAQCFYCCCCFCWPRGVFTLSQRSACTHTHRERESDSFPVLMCLEWASSICMK